MTEQKDFSKQRLTQVDFSSQNLTEANFSEAVLVSCNFDSSNLSYADFTRAKVYRCTFRQSKLYHTNFKDAHLAYSLFDPRDFFGMTVTLHCETFDKVKMPSKVYQAAWLFYLLIMDVPEELKEKIRVMIKELVGEERFKALHRHFQNRAL